MLYDRARHVLDSYHSKKGAPAVPTFLTHGVAGLAVAAVTARKGEPWRYWLMAAGCAMLPDLDVAAFALGIPYGHALGHRGLAHSLLGALVLGGVAAFLAFPADSFTHKRRWRMALVLGLATATHAPLDAMTSGGLGVALLAPFDHRRIFFPWTPIAVAPISPRHFFTELGLRVLLSELRWVWLPALALVAAARVLIRLSPWRSKPSRD